ncbi:hypothetical protein [Bacillus cereus group sp. BfR-BA-02730]|uniref:hypothetical protein n=1 Tax=Bacillus cereus group sp. BfR-BA-02730 TaxID=3094893 RepID=UPI0029C2BE11|nr:hypothetical protein [Bacillus cereus group sp. BfR-BA-02730]MDX5808611.1 hypothetical protein [Bacillus cereus group sp. BfR-BA-02730]
MKSRYKKHLKRMSKRSPIISFSQADIHHKGSVLIEDELSTFSQHMKLNHEETYSDTYTSKKKEMISNLYFFVDNYLMCGGHNYVFLLVPLSNGFYQVFEKENISEWVNAYWQKEDPKNQRDWSYMDEDINDLFDYMINQFNKHVKKKKKRVFTMKVSIKEMQQMIKDSIANNPPKPIVVGEVREGAYDYLCDAIKNS